MHDAGGLKQRRQNLGAAASFSATKAPLSLSFFLSLFWFSLDPYKNHFLGFPLSLSFSVIQIANPKNAAVLLFSLPQFAEMKLTVKTLKGSHFEIRVQPNDTVIPSLFYSSILTFPFIAIQLFYYLG